MKKDEMISILQSAMIDESNIHQAIAAIFAASERLGVGVNELFHKIAKSENKLELSHSLFGDHGAVSGVILSIKLP
jgi:hypothetical protein